MEEMVLMTQKEYVLRGLRPAVVILEGVEQTQPRPDFVLL